MKAVARALGKEVLRETDEEAVISAIPSLRGAVGDRAILRAIHFFKEDLRAATLSEALAQNDIPRILALFSASGRSSQQLLQNAWPDGDSKERGLSLALALSGYLLQDEGACRIHGGGFAGSILALVPQKMAAVYRQKMESAFGLGSCRQLFIRPVGAGEILI